MRQLVNDVKALRTMRKTPTILTTVLHGVTQEQAVALRDGPDGWSVLYIVCHLRDLETVFIQRAQDLLAMPNATLAVVSNEELIRLGDYDAQDMRAALKAYLERRQAFIALLESLDDEQWIRSGAHPVQGPATVLDVAVNAGLHDVDHIEQIIRCLG
jgi:hypothetical protein